MKAKFTFFVLLISVYYSNSQNFTFSIGDTTEIELITFESETVHFKQGSSTTDCWQIGQPSKLEFSEAFSGSNAIVTDTLNSYPANNHSWFDLKLSDYVFYEYIGISFYHKLNTENSKDGGFISISYDSGNTWSNIIDDDLCPFVTSPTTTPDYYTESLGLYTKNDTLFNGQYGFSGDIMEWQKVQFNWVKYVAVKKNYLDDTVIVRFNFISDPSNNQEGWMIDNIRLFTVELPGAINDNYSNSNLEFYPNPIVNNSVLKSKNGESIKGVELFNFNGQLLRTETVNADEYNFEKQQLNPGIYFLHCTFSNKIQESVKIIIE